MRKQIVSDAGAETQADEAWPGQAQPLLYNAELLEKSFFFHDIAVHCRANDRQLLDWLDEMPGAFLQPAHTRGEVQYTICWYEDAAHFPLQLPPARRRTDTIQLLPGTLLKYYDSADAARDYHRYAALEGVNGTSLTVIERNAPVLITQLEQLERYQPAFLRRYVYLLALGHVMSRFGFEPFHAAAISAPWDERQGALIVGASGSGKTTLGIGCAIAGCGLLGDDLVLLRAEEGNEAIAAYAVTHEVALRSGSLGLWDTLSFLTTYAADRRDKRYCSINDIRAESARLSTPIGLLLFPTLTGEARSHAIPMSKAQTLQALIEQTISTRHQHHHSRAELFALLGQLAQQASGYRVFIARGANDGPELVRSLFAGARYG